MLFRAKFFFLPFFPEIKMILSFACKILWRQVKFQIYRAIEEDDFIDEKEDRKKIPEN